MKLWHAVFAALLFFIPAGAQAAEDGSAAARELARRTAALAGRGEPVAVTWNNVSSLGSAELLQARNAFEAALREAGGRAADSSPAAEARVTLSENRTQYLLVEEIRRGDDRQVWISAWKRGEPNAMASTLERKLAWEQEETMLDVAFPAQGMLVLSPSKVTLYTRQNGPWKAAASMPVPSRNWPRDLRGHLRVNAGNFQAYLPGLSCSGVLEPALTLDCHSSEEPWVLESGSRSMLLAYFVPGKNYFDGRAMTQGGVKKTRPPFYSAAAADEPGGGLWLLALVDGRTEIVDSALEPAGSIGSWGSDIAGTDAHCGNGSQVLATRTGDSTAGDAIQAFSIVNRSAVPLTRPMEFPGPVTALWSTGGAAATAIVRDLATGRYQAYVITITCE